MRAMICLAMLALAAAPAAAQESSGAATAAAPEFHSLAAEQSALSVEDLAAVNGRQGATSEVTLLSDQDLSATSSGNSITANTVRSGDVAFGAGALSAFSGVGNFVVNTGNNNNLQGAISVSIITAPSP